MSPKTPTLAHKPKLFSQIWIPNWTLNNFPNLVPRVIFWVPKAETKSVHQFRRTEFLTPPIFDTLQKTKKKRKTNQRSPKIRSDIDRYGSRTCCHRLFRHKIDTLFLSFECLTLRLSSFCCCHVERIRSPIVQLFICCVVDRLTTIEAAQRKETGI